MGKGRAPCCDKSKVKTGPWSPREDLTLITFIQRHGHSNWRSLPKEAGLLRCGKSCRLRWVNYLRPDLKRGPFSPEEEEMIIKLHQTLGNKWSKIASYFPGRTDNEIKNVWNTHFRKKLAKTGDDHKNKDEANKDVSGDSSFSQSSSSMSSISREESPKEVIGNIHLDNLMPDEFSVDANFWSNWDMEDPFQFSEALPMDQAVSESSMPLIIPEEGDGNKEMEDYQEWFKNLEKELGLDQTTTNEVFDGSYFEPFMLF